MKEYWQIGILAWAFLAAPAGASIWGDWAASGNGCNANNVSVLDSGNTLAVLFDEFGIRMPAGQTGDGLTSTKNCNFQISVQVPSGYYLSGFTQLFQGGILKSARSAAQLKIQYVVGPAGGHPIALVWNANQAIDASSPNSSFSRQIDEPLAPLFCDNAKPMFYKLAMSFNGMRPSLNDFLEGGLDSVDAGPNARLWLTANWAPCPVFNDDERNITGLYRILLKRFADAGGLQAWTNLLHRQGLEAVARGIRSSPEFQKGNRIPDPEPIAELYRQILGREPDPRGLAGWVKKASVGQLSMTQLEQIFRNSPEARRS
jgi:hypothetical protein